MPPIDGARAIAVSSGKGGVGKTNVTANLAIAFAAQGKRVVVIDADYALANIDILLGFNPKYTIEHVLDGSMSIGEIIMDGPGGIKVVPAASGVQRLAQLDEEKLNKLYNALQLLEKHFDYLLIDTAAGIGETVTSILHAAGEVLIVTNPEPPAFVDSYALIKHLISTGDKTRIRLVVNQVSSEDESDAVYGRIEKTVSKFLERQVEYLGYVIDDDNVKKAVRQRRPFILQYPNSVASRCISTLANRLLNEKERQKGGTFLSSLKETIGKQSATG
jgi:flagellar biosynthesis protein FlhG